MSLRYLSVCSGIEAATVAWEPLGFVPVGFSEIEKLPSAVLAHHYGSNMPGEPLSRNGVPNYGDFTKIDLNTLPKPIDMLVGGTPCQAFSIAGQRLSLADARGNLTLSYVVLAHELAGSHGLKIAVWENVPGVPNTPDNAFGCFLGALVGADAPLVSTDKRGRWPNAGMVAGPKARLAWRVLDAQYFGLAQRRKRVFVVADFGGGPDPAAVLFERQGLFGNPAPRREARKDAAGDAAGGVGKRGAFGGGRTGSDLEQAATLTAKGQRIDFEVETFIAESAPTLPSRSKAGGGMGTDFDCDGGLIAAEVTGKLPAGGNATGGHRPPGMGQETADTFLIAHSLRGEGFDASEDGTGRGTPLVPVAYRTTGNSGAWETGDKIDTLTAATDPNAHVIAIQERAVSENPNAGPQGLGVQSDVAYTLEARHHVQAVAFSSKDHGADASFAATPTLRAMGHAESHANAGGQLAVAFDLRGREGGASSRSYVAHQWAVRRLTPKECERLQGFPDFYTAIPWRGKDAGDCPDGPRYKALGNSFAVPVVRWIGRRIKEQAIERAAGVS